MIVDNQSFTSYTPQVTQNSPFIATVTTTGIRNESVPTAKESIQSSPESEPESKSKPEKSVVVTWNTPAEARQAFESLLAEVVTSPSTSWKDAVPQLTKDIRFTVDDVKEVRNRQLRRQDNVNRSSVSSLRKW